MPRDLGDVLHYFMPEIESADEPAAAPARRAPGAGRGAGTDPAGALGLVGVPLGHRDVLRATFVWNLAVETTAQGAPTTVVVPARMSPPVWPEPGRTPMGAEILPVFAEGLAELTQAALDVAATRAAEVAPEALVLVCIPPSWLAKAADGAALLRQVLLFSSPESADIIETYALAKHLLTAAPEARVGVTVFGVQSVAAAARTFDQLTQTAQRHLGCDLTSYGLLIDELQIYRAIVDRRPIGISQPQSRAARSLRDVARLLLDDVTALVDDAP